MTMENVCETNAVELVATQHSKITNINLYSGRAEITRLFEISVKAGRNKVVISGLPQAFQEDSLRVEGLGNASIHDVIVEKTTSSPFGGNTMTPAESELRKQRRVIEKALESAEKSRATLNNYLNTISANDFNIPRLEATLDGYMTLSRKVDEQILDLEKDLADVMAKIKEEQLSNHATSAPNQSWKVSIDVHGQVEEIITIRLVYAVNQVDWTASYDIRVNTLSKEKVATILYKASIIQSTGESWENVPLKLETMTPSFGVTPPVLHPWYVKPYQVQPSRPLVPMAGVPMAAAMSAQPTVIYAPSGRSRSRSRSRSRRRMSSPPPVIIAQPVMIPTSNKGSLAATFQIAGLVSIPSDGTRHNVPVAQLDLEAVLTWYTIPAKDARVYLKAKINNNSKYTFVPGNANIYVDGSFIATTRIPSASPQEEFECLLGLDSSIRVTYHSREKKSGKTGFYSKSSNQLFTQRISIFNSRTIPVQNLRVIDHVPVSEDERIEVKLLNPNLILPSTSSTNTLSLKNADTFVAKSVKVADNVLAQWDSADEPDKDPNSIGKDGKINWIVSIPPQKTVSIILQFDVNYPESLVVTGI
uniref:Mucoidy inhibitor A n=1 Tax=Psilocybe cubensis TaxID=181762 RepID=A0A8H7Y1K3_PSICU